MDFKRLILIFFIPLIVTCYVYLLEIPLEKSYIMHCLMITFVVHIIFGAPSIIYKSEYLFDLTGSIAVLSMLVYLVIVVPNLGLRSLLLLVMASIWTIRLGSFLFLRIHKYKKDSRFDNLKQSFLSFIITWELSAVWTFITILCVISASVSVIQVELGLLDYLAIILWVLSFIIEVVADFQKLNFKKKKNNLPFITTGLWQYSRHPNYFGEIAMWFCIALISYPNLYSWLYLSLISPFFVMLLLTKISGINLLEQANIKKYGHIKEYQDYINKTSTLIPKIFH